MHGEGNAASREQFRVAGVVLVIVREHRAGDRSLLEKAGEGAARVREARVHEDAADEVGAHIQSRDSAAEARQANALDVAEALDLDHGTKVVVATTVRVARRTQGPPFAEPS